MYIHMSTVYIGKYPPPRRERDISRSYWENFEKVGDKKEENMKEKKKKSKDKEEN
jgi:hypothetical protein